MSYYKEINIRTERTSGKLYVSDDEKEAKRLRKAGEAVLIYFHENNRSSDFSGFLFGTEDPEEIDTEYAERVYRRIHHLPWYIMETDRCVIRETTTADVDDFFEIYSNPSITEFMEDLYPDKNQEKAYIEEYIEKIYTFYEFGVWTIIEKETNRVIGRAGFSYRAGYDEPEIGFVIGVPWQRKGYAYEVCSAILKYGSDILGFDKVQSLVEIKNVASLQLCKKLGFEIVKQVNIEGKEYYLLIYNI